MEAIPSRDFPHLIRDVLSMLRRRSKFSSHYHPSVDPAGSSKSVSRPSARIVRTTPPFPSRVVHRPIHIFHRVWGHRRDRVPTRGPPRHALCPSLCAFIVSFLFPVARKRHTNSCPVCILQLGRKDHGKALRSQRCLTTPAHTHPSRPRARLGRPRPNVTRPGIDLPALG